LFYGRDDLLQIIHTAVLYLVQALADSYTRHIKKLLQKDKL
jgi:hypothetical protein